MLNFHGRVTIASVKNMQLIRFGSAANDQHGVDPANVLLQFGKVGGDDFHFDVRWPLSPLQAFAICLSSVASKKSV